MIRWLLISSNGIVTLPPPDRISNSGSPKIPVPPWFAVVGWIVAVRINATLRMMLVRMGTLFVPAPTGVRYRAQLVAGDVPIARWRFVPWMRAKA